MAYTTKLFTRIGMTNLLADKRISIKINEDIWNEFEKARKKTGKSKNLLINECIVFSLHWAVAQETVFQSKVIKSIGKAKEIYEKIINKPEIQKQIWDEMNKTLSQEDLQEFETEEGIFDERSKKLLKKPKRGRRATKKIRKTPGRRKKSEIYN